MKYLLILLLALPVTASADSEIFRSVFSESKVGTTTQTKQEPVYKPENYRLNSGDPNDGTTRYHELEMPDGTTRYGKEYSPGKTILDSSGYEYLRRQD